ncbi:helix-turn-helix domain-containing protein [Niveispirillum sp. SYP-B3756]|uniref:helix-turn-helix domain-containing protein n=1 Tax=Niveispirillum sp. SYP-B3756 TaxID=2662178 RepID=UPI00129251D1|nr:helix-turn-helix transcriptional regulator [Niveispirillum sp. SYP-B3756]MQP67498.1 helix-turn-helix domain-containing protein [Niveispirillum sp. SYP-B3756]
MARPLKPETAFSSRLIEARLPMEREQFAVHLGVPKTTLGNWERGRSEPPLEMLEKIRRITGVSLDWLIAGVGPMRGDSAGLPGLATGYNRNLMQALIEVHLEQAESMGVTLTPEQLSAMILNTYDKNVADLHNLMAPPAAKSA